MRKSFNIGNDQARDSRQRTNAIEIVFLEVTCFLACSAASIQVGILSALLWKNRDNACILMKVYLW